MASMRKVRRLVLANWEEAASIASRRNRVLFCEAMTTLRKTTTRKHAQLLTPGVPGVTGGFEQRRRGNFQTVKRHDDDDEQCLLAEGHGAGKAR